MLTPQSYTALKNVDIRDVVGRYVALKKDKACCPIHNEKSPSFKVYTRSNSFKCFGCGAGGDAISFVERMDKIDFIDAAQKVADIGRVSLEFEGNHNKEAYQQKRKADASMKDTIRWALDLYSAQLVENEDAMSYLKGRNLSEETIAHWNLGFAPDQWQFLCDKVVGHHSPAAAVNLGLIAQKEESGRFYDRFRKRIIFPVLNEYGEPISLSGRTIGEVTDQNPKTYKGLNSAIFSADRALFGLYQARKAIEAMKYAIMVEGEMDVIQMHQSGADNTVGFGKSHISQEQAKVLRRFTDTVLLIPDMDISKAGLRVIKGVEENIQLLLSFGFKVEVMILPAPAGKKMDADDWAKTFIPQPELLEA